VVLSTEGGYSATRPLVARQYGKVSLVKPDMKSRAIVPLSAHGHQGGDYNHPPMFLSTVAPAMYLGKAGAIEPDPEESACSIPGLVEK